MLNLFTSAKKRLERRLLKQCLNTEKPAGLLAVNSVGPPTVLMQPVAKSDDAAPMVRNVIGSTVSPAGSAEPLFVARKQRR